MLLSSRFGWVAPVLLLLSCNPYPSYEAPIPSDVSLSEHIVDNLTKGIQSSASMASLAPFEWDTLYSINRRLYPAEARELRRELGKWMEQFEAAPREKYKYTYLVFTNKGEVVRVAAFPDSRSYTFVLTGEEGYLKQARADAFINSEVLYSGGSPVSYKLELQGVMSPNN